MTSVTSNIEIIMKIIISPPESSVKRLLSEAQLPISDIIGEKFQKFFSL